MDFMTPIESPNLPKREIALAAVSVGAVKAKEYLRSCGIGVFDILPCAAITDGTAAHADLHLLHLGGRKIVLSLEQRNNAEKLTELGFDVQVPDTPLGDKYPADVPLNAALFGNYAILNLRTVCPNIDFSGRTLIPVRQGYTKCSVVPVTESAIITDDVSIARQPKKRTCRTACLKGRCRSARARIRLYRRLLRTRCARYNALQRLARVS